MASPPPPPAGQEEAQDPPGPPPMEQLGPDLEPERMDASLETRSVDRNPPGNPSHSNPPAGPFGGVQAKSIKLETAGLGLAPRPEADGLSQTNVSRAAQVPQTPQSPVDGPGLPPGWRKRVINVRNKLGTTKQKQPTSTALTSQKPEASGLDSSKPAHDGRGKTTETGKAEAAKREAKAPELPALVDLSNLALPLLPTVDIIAIPDIGQSLSTAWTYIPDKHFAKRPGTSSKRPPAPANATPGPPGRQLPVKGAAFRAGLKALEEIKSREERDGRVKGWTDTIDSNHPAVAPGGWKRSGPEHSTAILANEPPATPVDKGKEKADGDITGVLEDVERGRRPLTPQEPRVSTAEETGEKRADADDRTSRHSNRPSSAKGSKPPSEKDKGLKSANWLTDRTMLASDLDRARVYGFSYKFELPQSADNPSKKPDYDYHLFEIMSALIVQLQMKTSGHCPLVFVATGFGCLIVQKLMAFVYENPELEALVLGPTASVLFLDPPSPISKEKPKTEKLKTAPLTTGPLATGPPPTFPAPANSARANRLRAFLDSKAMDSWDLWNKFHVVVYKRELPVVWFYTQAQIPNKNSGSPRALGVDFVMLSDLAPAKHITGRASSRFRGPGDPNYGSFVEQVKRFLLLKASAWPQFEDLLKQCIEQGYNLDVKDWHKRSPLHLAVQARNDAALVRLVNARPSLVIEKDRNGTTPLHAAIIDVVRWGHELMDYARASYQMMIEKILLAMAENEYDDKIKDSVGKSPWDYLNGDNYQWVLELREFRYLFNGAQAAQPETIGDLPRLGGPLEAEASGLSTTIAQFYISHDDTRDYLEFQRPNVVSLIYDPHYGIDKLFERNLRHDDDKRATCRWVHIPANNEQWVHDLFARQRRIDNSTSARRHRGSAPFDRHIIPGAVRYKQTYEPLPGEVGSFPSPRYPLPSPSSFSNKSGDSGLGIPKKTVTALFVSWNGWSFNPDVMVADTLYLEKIPVFGFEKHGNRTKLSEAMRQRNPFAFPHDDETSIMIRAYFHNTKFPLHCRRTLDQFTYHMLDNTERRDNSQVMSRWAKKHKVSQGHGRPRKGGLPVLMIDQLWLWILEDEQTVITSLPNTWEPAKDYNLVRHIMQHELRDNDARPLIKDCTDLANSIIRRSVDFLRRKGPEDVTLYQSFQSSITLVAERQAVQFEAFKGLVRDLNQAGIDVQTRADLTNKLFRLTTETRLLAEIIDIQDELKTIHEVLLRQRDALKKFAKLMSKPGQVRDRADDESDIVDTHTPESSQFGYPLFEENDPESPDQQGERKSLHSALYRESGRPRLERNVRFADERTQYQRPRARNQAEENLHLVESNILTIKEMTTYAEKVRVEINGLLSHRQKQANAWEARFAREGSEHTQRQSNITLVFTAVTVLFLPLSFMSSVFAIQIDAFPHNPETGEVNWPLANVMGLLFGLSLGTILIVAFLGFYINRISRLYAKYFGSTNPTPPGGHHHQHHQHHHHRRHHSTNSDSDSDSDGDSGATTNSGRSTRSSQREQREQQEQYSQTTEDLTYASLFGRWRFHTRIPHLRNLWRWRIYDLPLPPPPPPPPPPDYPSLPLSPAPWFDGDGGFDEAAGGPDGDGYGDGDGDGEGEGEGGGGGGGGVGGDPWRAPSVASRTSWGDLEWHQTIRDYPLHRAQVLVGGM
ncbi:hypothetical protein B0I37DRAFT_235814 [Chaetomium sp. MPI-CAGE-AT-0009]|nr:hypothetical protein B0I37DRAFT_235814 [Chaetomium sp. MPI-CAGE-AT-0009]